MPVVVGLPSVYVHASKQYRRLQLFMNVHIESSGRLCFLLRLVNSKSASMHCAGACYSLLKFDLGTTQAFGVAVGNAACVNEAAKP